MVHLTYTQVLSHENIDVSDPAKVFALVREFPFRTSRELASKVNDNILTAESVHKRLPELAKVGLVSKANRRRCTVTGRLASTWVVR